jgi:hypothetical protein
MVVELSMFHEGDLSSVAERVSLPTWKSSFNVYTIPVVEIEGSGE